MMQRDNLLRGHLRHGDETLELSSTGDIVSLRDGRPHSILSGRTPPSYDRGRLVRILQGAMWTGSCDGPGD